MEWTTGMENWIGLLEWLFSYIKYTNSMYSPNQVHAIAFAWEVRRYVCLLVYVSASQAINHSSEIKPG